MNINAPDINWPRNLATGQAAERALEAELGSIEVKTNTRAIGYGNIFLEVEAAGRDGIRKYSNTGPYRSDAETMAFVIQDNGVTRSTILVKRTVVALWCAAQMLIGIQPFAAGNVDMQTWGYKVPLTTLVNLEGDAERIISKWKLENPA